MARTRGVGSELFGDPAASPVSRLAPLVPRASFCVFGLTFGLWLTQLRGAATKDWRLYYDTASLVAAGRVADVYPGVTPLLPLFYPPFFLWHVYPLAFVPRAYAYACIVAAQLAFTGIALAALRAALDPERRPMEPWIWVVLSSAGFTWTIVDGHITAWYLMLLSITVLLWARGAMVAAGVVSSLLLTKPHYALVVLGMIAAARAWRVLAGAAAGALGLVLTTVPLGVATWRAWAEQIGSAASVLTADTGWKQITIRATWSSLVGAHRQGAGTLLWLATALPCAGLAAWACWRGSGHVREPARVLALGALVALACGAYAFHYDGLLLVFPGLTWYFRRASYAPVTHRACGTAILTTYVIELADAWIWQHGISLTGLAIAAWLVIEAYDLLRSRPLNA